jgi:hypothetical protein
MINILNLFTRMLHYSLDNVLIKVLLEKDSLITMVYSLFVRQSNVLLNRLLLVNGGYKGIKSINNSFSSTISTIFMCLIT